MLSIFSIVPYACPVSRMCCAYFHVLFECIACTCSLYRVLKLRPVLSYIFQLAAITFYFVYAAAVVLV
jgi:hypothetical protein